MQIDLSILNNGELLPLVEQFYTLQGEGYHTGKAAFFIRIGGCDVSCSWCDAKFTWNPKTFPPVNIKNIVDEACKHPAKVVVVTGGEPSLYPLDHLCKELKAKGFDTHVETSGAHQLTGLWDWICLSPKPQQPPINGIHMKADELKVIISNTDDLKWAEENARKVKSTCKLYLQPEWSVFKSITPIIVEYAMANPQWQVSLQAHKFMHIP